MADSSLLKTRRAIAPLVIIGVGIALKAFDTFVLEPRRKKK